MKRIWWRVVMSIALLGGVAMQASSISATEAVVGSSSATFRGGPARTGEQPGPGPTGTPGLRWAAWLGFMISSSPVVVDGVVYVGAVSPVTEAGGALHAVDAETGEEIWQRATLAGDGIFASPTVVDGIVYAGSYDGIEFAVDAATGNELWRFQAEGSIYSSPAVVDGILYFGDDAGYLYALAATDGELLWQFVEGQRYDRIISSATAVVVGIVYVVNVPRREEEPNLLLAFDAQTGVELWRINGPTVGLLRGTPAVSGGVIYVLSTVGSLYAIDAATGGERWRYDGNSETLFTNAAVSDGLVYFATTNGMLFAIDAANGEEQWRLKISEVAVTSSPTVADGVVYAGDAEGVLCAVDAVTGEWRWRIIIESFMSNPAIVDGTIYIGGDEGILRALGDPVGISLHLDPS